MTFKRKPPRVPLTSQRFVPSRCTPPRHTSPSAALRLRRSLQVQTALEKDTPARQKGNERRQENRKGKTTPHPPEKRTTLSPFRKDTNDDGRSPPGHRRFNFRGFTVSSSWRRSRRWRRRAELVPARQTDGSHCPLCFLVSLQRTRKALQIHLLL